MKTEIEYYNEIKQEFINCEVGKRIKDYSKNKIEVNANYKVGEIIITAQGVKKELNMVMS